MIKQNLVLLTGWIQNKGSAKHYACYKLKPKTFKCLRFFKNFCVTNMPQDLIVTAEYLVALSLVIFELHDKRLDRKMVCWNYRRMWQPQIGQMFKYPQTRAVGSLFI